MFKINTVKLIGSVVLCLIALSGCNSKESAKKAIEQKGITYNSESFAKAIDSKNTELVDLFIKAGIDLGSPEALSSVIQAKDSMTLKKMIDAGLDPNANITFGKIGSAPLIIAASDSPELIEVLANAKNINLNAQNAGGATALMKAVKSNQPKTVELLVSKGADTKLMDAIGYDALLVAIDSGNDDSSAALIKALGKNLNAKTTYDKALAGVAPGVTGITAIMIAAGNCEPLTVDALISAGADVNAKTSNNITPLINVFRNGYKMPGNCEKVVNSLVAKGADKKVRDADGRLAADYASIMISRSALDHSGKIPPSNAVLDKVWTDGAIPLGGD